MSKFFKAWTGVAALLAPSLAAAETPVAHQFSRGGENYVYTLTTTGSRQVIDGQSTTSGVRFHLVVRGSAVSGEMGGQPVAFQVPAGARVAAIRTAAR